MTDLLKLWQEIESAGNIDNYIEKQLVKNGYLVERRDTEDMSKKELERYKKQLKQEAKAKKELKKKTWLAYKASHIVHVGEGIFWNDGANFDQWDHPRAEEQASANELPPLDSPKELAQTLGITIEELRWFTYHRDDAKKIHYRRFTIPKRSGGERNIWAPLPKLKELQRWILREIAEKLPIHGSCHGFVAGRSILSNAEVHNNSSIVVRMDLKDFFPTLTFPRVKGIFRHAGYREQIATLLALICTEAPREVIKHDGELHYISLGPRCLPQGAPTSPALSNVAGLKLDRRLNGLAKKLGWRYSRYADDLTFSLPEKYKKGNSQLGALLKAVPNIVNDEGFQINRKKTWVARKGGRQCVTGLIVNGKDAPRVPRKKQREIRSAIYNLQQGKELREGETIEQILGYVAFIYMSQPQKGKQLLEKIGKLGDLSKS